ncbi:MAG: hypothetical protein HZA47_08215 [Planctomycetes bacterium]|nr:hypothetical protein [Planctomycetota bacterium]
MGGLSLIIARLFGQPLSERSSTYSIVITVPDEFFIENVVDTILHV